MLTMAESNSASENANDNWFGSWLTAAKNKSCEVLEFVKKDLEEFGNVVKSEATSVVNATGTTLEKTLKLDEPESTVNTMKRSISSFLGQMNEVLNPSPDDSDTEAIMIVDGQETIQLTKLQKAIYELQTTESTFIDDPDPKLAKQYHSWLEIIDDQLSDERLSKHLCKSEMLRKQYTSLVPLRVEHGTFWKRYLFKKALLEDDIARHEAMEKREAKEKEATIENVRWEEEDFANDIELTEEEQIRLLEQYDHETKARPTPTTPTSLEKSTNAALGSNRQASPKRPTKTGPPPKNTKSLNEELEREAEKPVAASSSSTSSSDGDWEKLCD